MEAFRVGIPPPERGEPRAPRRLAALCLATGILFVALVLVPATTFPLAPLIPAVDLVASAAILLGSSWRTDARLAQCALWLALGLLLAQAAVFLYPYRAAPSYVGLIGWLYLAATALTLLLLRCVPRPAGDLWQLRHARYGIAAFIVAGALLAVATWYVLADL